jgi:hypothetical protein
MARLLTSVGVPCSHEMIFDYRGLECAEKRMSGEHYMQLSWASRAKYDNGKWTELDEWLPDTREIQAEASYMAAPYLSSTLLRDSKIIHVVRDPIKVINSFCNYIDFFKRESASNDYEQFVYNHLPELTYDISQYDRAALFWVRWNKMIEDSKPDLFYRVEDDATKVLDFLGKQGPCFSDNQINSFKKPAAEKFSIDKIKSKFIMEEFVTLGKRYGYPMLSQYLLV